MQIKAVALFALTLFSASAMADDGVCIPMAKLAKMSAEKREQGMTQNELLRGLIREGQLDPKSSTATFVANTVVWVYEENIPAKGAYKQMYEKCHKAFTKKR